MQVRQLLEEDDAVSPVIGVILMVAITVILAAVIASFVLGLGQQQSTTPTVSFTSEYSNFEANQGNLTINHDGGDTVRADEVYIRGGNGSSPGQFNDPWVNFTHDGLFDAPTYTTGTSNPGAATPMQRNDGGHSRFGGTNSSEKEGSPALVAGDSITFPTASDADLDVVYDPIDSSSTATLHEWSGPDA